jgi:hypothetical protein
MDEPAIRYQVSGIASSPIVRVPFGQWLRTGRLFNEGKAANFVIPGLTRNPVRTNDGMLRQPPGTIFILFPQISLDS